MRKQRFDNVCEAVRHGQDQQVEHQITHATGRVVACHGDNFDIEVAGRRQSWARQNCDSK